MQLELNARNASAFVAASQGGRLGSLEVAGLELLVVDEDLGTLQWGAYPMVPWAGRICDGTFSFDGVQHQMPLNLAPHAAHGTGLNSAWTILDETTIELVLASPWPYAGRVQQRFDLGDDRLTIHMTIFAEETMPIMLGWHPWFSRYLELDSKISAAELEFGTPPMYEHDDNMIPTGRLVPCPPGPWDNCFTALETNPIIRWPGMLEIELSSSCDHWVVYDMPESALCVEPQSAAADVFNRSPTVLPAGERMDAHFTIEWRYLA